MTSFIITFVIAYLVVGVLLAVYFGWPRGEVPSWNIRILTGLLIAATWPHTLYGFIGMVLMPKEDLERLLEGYEEESRKYRAMSAKREEDATEFE